MAFPISETLLARQAREDYSELMREGIGASKLEWEPIRRRIVAMPDREFGKAVFALANFIEEV